MIFIVLYHRFVLLILLFSIHLFNGLLTYFKSIWDLGSASYSKKKTELFFSLSLERPQD